LFPSFSRREVPAFFSSYSIRLSIHPYHVCTRTYTPCMHTHRPSIRICAHACIHAHVHTRTCTHYTSYVHAYITMHYTCMHACILYIHHSRCKHGLHLLSFLQFPIIHMHANVHTLHIIHYSRCEHGLHRLSYMQFPTLHMHAYIHTVVHIHAYTHAYMPTFNHTLHVHATHYSTLCYMCMRTYIFTSKHTYLMHSYVHVFYGGLLF
jgi:hypothetical protein